MRAVTISTHTALSPWWELFERDRAAYEARKSDYAERLLAAADRALPGIREAVDLALPANPVTFQRFARCEWGWVGGFPQTDLLRSWAPRIAPNLWRAGDSIFAGQSTDAVAWSGMRAADAVLSSMVSAQRAGDTRALRS